MESVEEFVGVPVIVTIIYVLMLVFKRFANGKESLIRLIPILSITIGCAVGWAAHYFVPDLLPCTSFLASTILGGGSGLAATGSHQVFKQFTKEISGVEIAIDSSDEDSKTSTTKNDKNDDK